MRVSWKIALLSILPLVAATPVAVLAPAQAASPVKIIRWVDGDTVETTAGEVRLIGVDTPERGRCGYGTATSLATRLAPAGSKISLVNPRSVQDADAYGRKLRYVVRGKVDVGLRQIIKGSRARYDSIDGYDHHPKQKSYRAADKRHQNYQCSSGSGGGAANSGSYPPISTNSCPAKARIKGNRGSNGWIYHVPGQQYYSVTNPEECFATGAAARKAGYRASKV